MDTPLLPPPTTPDLPPPTAPREPPPPPAAPPRKWGAWHIVAIVVGCLLVFPGLGMLAGGTAAAFAQAISTDDDGYFNFDLDRMSSDGVAIAAIDLWFDGDGVDAVDDTWLLDWLDVDVRLRVEGAGPTEDVFVGIARAADVEEYLAGATYSDVVELDGRTPRYVEVRGEGVGGAAGVESPVEQDFWVVSSSGDGEEEVVWEARGGRWAAVVMNADGSPEVAADVRVGARSDAVLPIAIGLIVVGVLVTSAAVVLIVIGVRGRRDRDGELAASDRPAGGPSSPGTSDAGTAAGGAADDAAIGDATDVPAGDPTAGRPLERPPGPPSG